MLSLIVLAHNKPILTAACLLAAVRALEDLDGEIVCVDNASTPALVEQLGPAFDWRRIRLLRNDHNLSFSAANNRAVAAARGDLLLFLNNDVELGPHALRALVHAMNTHPEVGVVGGRLEFPGGRDLQHAGIVQMLWGLASNYGAGASATDPRWQVPAERFAVTGACLAMPRRVFELVDGFDEGYRWGYEDVDLCLAARAAGKRVVYSPAVQGIHHESATLHAVRRGDDARNNYRRYRDKWDAILCPREHAYLDRLRADGVRRVVILGTGAAGRALARVLEQDGTDVVAFTSTRDEHLADVAGHRYIPLPALEPSTFDRLVVGTQFFFAIEAAVFGCDPTGHPLFPVIW